MINLKGTKTEANLMAAFAGESQARKKEGYEQIAALFIADRSSVPGNSKQRKRTRKNLVQTAP